MAGAIRSPLGPCRHSAGHSPSLSPPRTVPATAIAPRFGILLDSRRAARQHHGRRTGHRPGWRATVRHLALWLAACALLGLPRQARAAIIFSNFGPGDSYITSSGFDESGPAAPVIGTVRNAISFTVGGLTDFRFD